VLAPSVGCAWRGAVGFPCLRCLGFAMVNALYVRGLSVAVRNGWLTSQARIIGPVFDDQVFVRENGDRLFTLEKVSNCSVALCNETGVEMRRWLV